MAGVAEFLGYALRFLFGSLADRTRMYWPVTPAGYTIRMLAVPALALAAPWPAAALLIVMERSGRGMPTKLAQGRSRGDPLADRDDGTR